MARPPGPPFPLRFHLLSKDPAAWDRWYVYHDPGLVSPLPGPPLGKARGVENGNIFGTERFLANNFRLTAEIELRDGSIGRPGDGMCIVIIGTEEPPGVGVGGGGMGAAGLGAAPTMIWEFDNTSDNRGDQNDPNHLQFAYSPEGFDAVDWIRISPAPFQGLFVSLDREVFPLHNRLPPPAPPNRYTVEILLQDGLVGFFLTNRDIRLERTLIYTYTIEGFVPFEGYLGFTASTGGFTQAHIVHSVKLERFGDDCFFPLATVTREFDASGGICGDYQEGDVITVELGISDVFIPEPVCTSSMGIVVREVPPSGWIPFDISAGGVHDPQSGTIEWAVPTREIEEGRRLLYSVIAGSELTVDFEGIVRNASVTDGRAIGGRTVLNLDEPFDACGGIRCWNILGAYTHPFGSSPGDRVLRQDYLTDGSTTERDFVWFPGARIETIFGVAAARGLFEDEAGRNPDRVPTVFAWFDGDSLIDLQDDVFGGGTHDVMTYAQVYVLNTTGDVLPVHLGISSEDSIQVLLNEEEVWIHSVERGGATACEPQDLSRESAEFPGPHLLWPGENRLVVKVFQGEGDGWNFALVFLDEAENPITEGLEIRRAPCRPSLEGVRRIETGETVLIEGEEQPRWRDGETYDVVIELSRVQESGPCPSGLVTVKETVPPGWVPFSVSNGGEINGDQITWVIAGPDSAPEALRYDVTAAGPPGTVRFQGWICVGGIMPQEILGDTRVFNPAPFTAGGFITEWLLLGPYQQPTGLVFGFGATPGLDEMRQDHLTDGDAVREFDVEPRAGDTVQTAYRPEGPARSLGLEPTDADINPGSVPTWFAWRDLDDTIDFDDYYGGDEDVVMMYAVTYLELAEDTTVDIGLASDASVQVLLDGQEIWIRNIAREFGMSNSVQDVVRGSETPALSPLRAGRHRIMVKVFEGRGAHGFRLRLQDPATGQPLGEGLRVCLDPECAAEAPGFVRGDANSDGEINLSDAITILQYLFVAGTAPACEKAADADASGRLDITDPIRILGWLFLGGQPPAPPSPAKATYDPGDCGTDRRDDGLACASPAETCRQGAR